jgi:hypothetical protein
VRQIGPFCTLQAVDTEDAEADQNGGYFACRPCRCLAFCEGQSDQSCLVPTVCPLRVQQVHPPGLLAIYHQRHRGVSQAGWQIMGQLQAPLLDVVKTALEAAVIQHRRQLLRGSDCSTTYLQSQIYVTQ